MKGHPRTVFFINPPGPPKLYRSMVCTFVSKANYIWQPQDFINLSAQIPPTCKLKFIDCSINNKNKDDVFSEIRQGEPFLNIIAISSLSFEQDLNFLKDLKADFPGIKCLVLGDILLERVFWEKVLQYCDGLILNSLDIDLAGYIENNEAFSKNIVLKGSASNGLINTADEKAKIKKVSIGIPRHELFINKSYRFPFVKAYLYSTVMSQFGCPFHCYYCSCSKIPVSYRDYQEVLAEIEKIKSLGVRDIFFADPSFGFPRENATLMLREIIKRNINIRWCCYGNPLLLDNEILTLMKKAGCHTIIIGVDDENLDMLRDDYKRTLTKERLMDFSKQCRLCDIEICGDFIIGLDADNIGKEKIGRIINLAGELKLDYASFNIYSSIMGSIIREKLVEAGRLDQYAIGPDTSGVLGHTEGKIINFRNLAIKKFYLRPSYLLRRLFKIKSLTELNIQLEEMRVMFINLRKSQRTQKYG